MVVLVVPESDTQNPNATNTNTLYKFVSVLCVCLYVNDKLGMFTSLYENDKL